MQPPGGCMLQMVPEPQMQPGYSELSSSHHHLPLLEPGTFWASPVDGQTSLGYKTTPVVSQQTQTPSFLPQYPQLQQSQPSQQVQQQSQPQPQRFSRIISRDKRLPLTVDTSVEYEIPAGACPPKDSEPLLIVHPQYFEYRRHKRLQGGACSCQLCRYYGRASSSSTASSSTAGVVTSSPQQTPAAGVHQPLASWRMPALVPASAGTRAQRHLPASSTAVSSTVTYSQQQQLSSVPQLRQQSSMPQQQRRQPQQQQQAATSTSAWRPAPAPCGCSACFSASGVSAAAPPSLCDNSLYMQQRLQPPLQPAPQTKRKRSAATAFAPTPTVTSGIMLAPPDQKRSRMVPVYAEPQRYGVM